MCFWVAAEWKPAPVRTWRSWRTCLDAMHGCEKPVYLTWVMFDTGDVLLNSTVLMVLVHIYKEATWFSKR